MKYPKKDYALWFADCILPVICGIALITSGFTCSKNIPKESRRESHSYSLIAYKGTTGSQISYGNTRAECEELKSKLEEKSPDTVYRCREQTESNLKK